MSIFDREDLKYPQAAVDIRKNVIRELKTNYAWAVKRLNEVCASREFEPNKFDEYISQDCGVLDHLISVNMNIMAILKAN